ncbi:Rieske (2Fe-2S) protein [Tumebacillus avium]|uniref:Rieske (2Fe-2S) protein n=1 Tax=Tumebacillus avium TaxID=1903704 RepID=A0A1Y0IQ68_9BACL|nr:ubiquinol-cytochrome c reductase iron-sulfur subunit [Tumebacillus avium]ARU62577.1 Rieske (2Fe-2S) protein [Tumebacillus avium]
MSDQKNQGKEGLSRRQFLTYALGGTGAFMAATIAAPLIPFTLDPLTRSGAGTFVDSGLSEADVKADLPQLIEFKVHRKDGWIEENAKYTAWVIKDEQGKILAMSPVCTHLGCQVAGTTDPNGNAQPAADGKWWFHCPCHGGRYTVTGINDPTKPPTRPLDLFETKVEGGKVMISSKLNQRKA